MRWLAIVAVASLIGSTAHAAPQGMCFKSGERTSGMNKICTYECAGSERETTVGAAQLCPLNIRDLGSSQRSTPPQQQPQRQSGMLCLKAGERTSGMNKICYYECPNGDTSRTVGAAQVCPLNTRQ